jgi:hypothetical protein
VEIVSMQRHIAELAGTREIELVPVTELVTHEGETALLGGATFREDGLERECVVAIAGDAPYALFEGIGTDVRRRVRSLIARLGIGLGRRRRRPFSYEPPEGWTCEEHDDSTTWLHPDFPRTHARLSVFDARPFRDSDAERLDRFLFLRVEAEIVSTDPDELETLDVPGLEGRLRITRGHVDGAHVVRAVAALADDTFVYLAHYETRTEDLALFRAVLASIRPVPRATEPRQLAVIWSDV